MKKILSVILSLAMISSMSISAFAASSEISTYTSPEGISADQTISRDDIAALPESIKYELQKDESTLVSISTTYVDLETNTQSRAVMPTSDFKMTVTASRLTDAQMAQDGVSGDAFKFVATGEWIVNPLFEFTDCIGLSWSDEFTLYDDTGYSFSYNPDGIPFMNFDALTLNDVSPEQGFAYDADLNLFDRQDEIVIVGKVYKANSSGSANVCASYGHVTIKPSSVDVSFSSGKEVGMSVGFASAIEMASPNYKSFNY